MLGKLSGYGLLGAIGLLAIAVAAFSAPDLIRYIKISRM